MFHGLFAGNTWQPAIIGSPAAAVAVGDGEGEPARDWATARATALGWVTAMVRATESVRDWRSRSVRRREPRSDLGYCCRSGWCWGDSCRAGATAAGRNRKQNSAQY